VTSRQTLVFVTRAGGRLLNFSRISMLRSPSCPQFGHLMNPVIMLSCSTVARSTVVPQAWQTCIAMSSSSEYWFMLIEWTTSKPELTESAQSPQDDRPRCNRLLPRFNSFNPLILQQSECRDHHRRAMLWIYRSTLRVITAYFRPETSDQSAYSDWHVSGGRRNDGRYSLRPDF
jgi:hypothetical protein